jgi:pyruvate formate lyase activating enzyme
MSTCIACGVTSRLISDGIGACAACIKAGDPKALDAAQAAHRRQRNTFGLPEEPPRDLHGVTCDLCVRTCRIGEGRVGYCRIRTNHGGILKGGDEERGKVSAYHDPLPTNCVADWVCPAGTECNDPRFSYAIGPEYGYTNLAVFYEACSFDCLFCQNWTYRRGSTPEGGFTPSQLAASVDTRTACVCYFGGDPGPQARHALAASKIAIMNNPDRPLRICWETNGSVNPKVLDEWLKLSIESGGCIKFDLKAFNPNLHLALCGITNKRTLSNFKRAAAHIPERPDPPLVIASTLLVPGYVDADEVKSIAEFIAAIDVNIPYSLLAFHPQFMMKDLPITSRRHAEEAVAAARSAGLTRIHIGNTHLLGRHSY